MRYNTLEDFKSGVGEGVRRKNAELFGERAVVSQPATLASLAPKPLTRMNKTETRFAQLLEGWKLAGDILDYKFESVTLRLAPHTHYRTDFVVWLKDGRTRFYEVKGSYVRDDAWQKLKTVAVLYPQWEFVRAQWKDGAWHWLTLPNE
jgi:hypothetical protein